MAEMMIAGSLLSASFKVLFERLACPLFVKFFKSLTHHKEGDKLLKKLRSKLLRLSVVLNDSEKQQFTNQLVKDWMDELKDAIYHADDLLDEIATKALGCKVEAEYLSAVKNQVTTSTSTSDSSLYDAKLVSQMEEIIERLEWFLEEKDDLGLKEVADLKGSHFHRLPSTSLVDESGVYGRDDDKEKIIKILLLDEASSNKIDVIPIIGMGGIGKTTLAQLIYNDGRVVEHFDMKAWVCVSDEFDVLRVTKTILEAITSINYDSQDLNLLQVKLKESLMGKKFLIVLDDVWNENPSHWEILCTPFTAGAYGSKIVATTRNRSVASIMQTIPVHHLQHLSKKNCWLLFAKIAFVKGDSKAFPKLEKIGKQIVRRCKGLPLAAKTLAGLLRFKHDVEEWDEILKSDIWDLPEDKNNILPALRLSYHYLSSHLKQCFAFCSTFPKDYGFVKEKLVLFWIALNYVQQTTNNKTLEKIGEEYFHELLSSGSGIDELKEFHHLRAKLTISGLQNVRSGRDALEAKLKKKKHLEEIVLEWGNTTESSRNEREVLENLQPHTNLKCLTIKRYGGTRFPEWLGDHSYSNMVSFFLDECDHCLSLPPLGKLSSLKHLHIARMNGITKVGEEFYGDGSSTKPFQSLKTLRFEAMLEWEEWHILGAEEFSQLTELCVIKCPKLVGGLPKQLPSWVRLEIRECSALTASLPRTSVANELVLNGCNGVELGWQGNCPSLVSFPDTLPLMLTSLEVRSCEALDAFAVSVLPITLISIHISECQKLVFSVSEEMECGNSSLERLTLHGCGTLKSLPLGFFPKLRLLDIANFEILSIPNGHGLKISTSLESVEINECNSMVSCLQEALHAPNLKSFRVRNCRQLNSLPEGMHSHFPSLKSLRIWNCPEIESFPEGGLPSNLLLLLIGRCKKLVDCWREWGLQRLPSLTDFTFGGGYYEEEDDVGSPFWKKACCPPTLVSLWIYCQQNLKSINYQSFQHLTCLKMLRIVNCPQLQSLPEEGFLPFLIGSASRSQDFGFGGQVSTGGDRRWSGFDSFVCWGAPSKCRGAHKYGIALHPSEIIIGYMKPIHKTVAVFVVGVDTSATETRGTVLIHSAEQRIMQKLKKPMLRSSSKQLQTQVPRLLLVERQLERWHCTSLKLGSPNPDDLGYVDSVSVEEIGSVRVTIVSNEEVGNSVCTVVLRGSTDSILDDIERAVDDGVNTYKAMCRDSRIVPAAAATEIELARRLKEFFLKETGLDQYAIAKFAESFEMVPKTLAENAGLNAMEIISSLYAEHASGNTKVGSDFEEGVCKDVSPMNIWDLHVTKEMRVHCYLDEGSVFCSQICCRCCLHCATASVIAIDQANNR
ncbi:unnamed protein product [Camellia sinensis]